ncbi:uncharacterized protein BT62DRAFT_474162 [Guyanagaster necrorhizus]|uniref:F-box domain-containing protein n=1 Tax=Guyanagaster necrorhizus TaxID=856835 RepID=A0A9P7VJF1_9AGAR|nr:uncharacterized protein BT62DRAFT_474162 [Guyanagaster necrorhizus MCA 3950]KAG7441582.1 hypothetical protein BT62DRAFT_474162 [Guyanagaster necrorhizus MCA 3950]
MAQTLPLELIEHITDEFRPDIETLRSSSLISKQWTVPAQQRLFSRVSIFPELVRAVPSTIDFPSSEDCAGYPFPQYVMDGSIDKFRELLEQAPHLADFVQELHLGTLKRRAAHVSYYYNSEEVLDGAFTRASEIVVRFWNLGSMSLSFAEDYDWEKLAFMHESLFHAVGSLRLRYLKIGHVTFPTRSQFIELLGNCVALQVLIIDYVKIGADADSETRQDAVEKLGPRLTELAVHAEPQSLSQIIQAFILPSSPVDVSSLLRLSLWCQYPKERTYQLISPTCSLLCKAQCLQHLRLFTSLAGTISLSCGVALSMTHPPPTFQARYINTWIPPACKHYMSATSSLDCLPRFSGSRRVSKTGVAQSLGWH